MNYSEVYKWATKPEPIKEERILPLEEKKQKETPKRKPPKMGTKVGDK